MRRHDLSGRRDACDKRANALTAMSNTASISKRWQLAVLHLNSLQSRYITTKYIVYRDISTICVRMFIILTIYGTVEHMHL